MGELGGECESGREEGGEGGDGGGARR